ncbi:MAG: ferredoxin:glutaredoxin reductase [Candidatus Eisenbacteria bacterium]|nr:ferredoxin:glutaredoxin reductase [Candidatus Eisenbacteria bacterium]
MSLTDDVPKERVDALIEELTRDAEASGYHLNPDRAFLDSLARGLAANEKRFGYRACPCRLASGDREDDIDIICPCYYRDPDLSEYGACYCALYVSEEVLRGDKDLEPVPERRPPEEDRARARERRSGTGGSFGQGAAYPVWRCEVCGYLCARDDPPEVCPICKARRDRFTRFA